MKAGLSEFVSLKVDTPHRAYAEVDAQFNAAVLIRGVVQNLDVDCPVTHDTMLSIERARFFSGDNHVYYYAQERWQRFN